MAIHKSFIQSRVLLKQFLSPKFNLSVGSSIQKCFLSSSTDSSSLDKDTTWEADILRHERNLDRMLKQGVKPEDLPLHKNEERVKDLPHFSFRNRSQFVQDESLLDATTNLLLGKRDLTETEDGEVSNIDSDFIREDVQAVLKRIHFRCNMDKVYTHKIVWREKMPLVKYYTDEQLKQERKKFEEKLSEKIRMPLVMKERQPCDTVLSNDDVLDGYEDSKICCVDISEDIKNRDRFIVVREPTGLLRKASWEERDRLLQVYLPIEGRCMVPPSLFKEENLKNSLEQNLHTNILDQCTVQFEPDSSEYIKTFEAVYEDINKKKQYGNLRSTRYFGGLVFYLVKNESVDGILNDMIRRDLIEDVGDLIHLFTLIHPESKTSAAMQSQMETDPMKLLQVYIENDSKDVRVLSMALEKENDPTNECTQSEENT